MLTKSFQQLSCLYHKRRLLECFSLQVTSARMLNNNPETILKIHLQLSLANDCKYSTYDTYSLISGTMYCWYKDIIITSQQKSLQFLLKPFIPQATMKNCKDSFYSCKHKKKVLWKMRVDNQRLGKLITGTVSTCSPPKSQAAYNFRTPQLIPGSIGKIWE